MWDLIWDPTIKRRTGGPEGYSSKGCGNPFTVHDIQIPFQYLDRLEKNLVIKTGYFPLHSVLTQAQSCFTRHQLSLPSLLC